MPSYTEHVEKSKEYVEKSEDKMDVDPYPLIPDMIFSPPSGEGAALAPGARLGDQGSQSPLEAAGVIPQPPVVPPTLDLLSDRLSDYTLMSRLGKGAFGTVFVAKSHRTGRNVAIKVVKRQHADCTKMYIHVEKEVLRRLTETKSLAFVRMEESFVDLVNYYVVMEYMSGGDLGSELRRSGGRFTIQRTRDYMAELVHGLSHIHSLNILHRDIKPENILLDSTGQLVLTDFGLARDFTMGGAMNGSCSNYYGLHNMTMAGCGTPAFMAPEAHLGLPYDFAADVWSLGCTMYVMLFGDVPFRASSDEGLRFSITHGHVYIPPDCLLDATSLSFLLKLLEKNPLGRMAMETCKHHDYFLGCPFDFSTGKYVEKTPWSPRPPKSYEGKELKKDVLLEGTRSVVPWSETINEYSFIQPPKMEAVPVVDIPERPEVDVKEHAETRIRAGLNLIKRLVMGKKNREVVKQRKPMALFKSFNSPFVARFYPYALRRLQRATRSRKSDDSMRCILSSSVQSLGSGPDPTPEPAQISREPSCPRLELNASVGGRFTFASSAELVPAFSPGESPFNDYQVEEGEIVEQNPPARPLAFKFEYATPYPIYRRARTPVVSHGMHVSPGIMDLHALLSLDNDGEKTGLQGTQRDEPQLEQREPAHVVAGAPVRVREIHGKKVPRTRPALRVAIPLCVPKPGVKAATPCETDTPDVSEVSSPPTPTSSNAAQSLCGPPAIFVLGESSQSPKPALPNTPVTPLTPLTPISPITPITPTTPANVLIVAPMLSASTTTTLAVEASVSDVTMASVVHPKDEKFEGKDVCMDA